MFTRFFRQAGLAVVACLAMFAAGCAGDDDSGGGGGGSKIAPPPTARPSFTGMSTVLSANGGSSNSGNNQGADGGFIQIIAFQGRVIHGAASSPGINANFLAPALALGNTVTYTQLSTLDPTKFSLASGTARVDLFGQDFHLPSGATLDLSDAPTATVSTLIIFTHGTGDFIRLDGNVASARAGGAAVAVHLTSGTNPAMAISVNGNMDMRGAADQDSGTFRAQAFVGSVSMGGTVDCSSVASTTPGTAGSIALLSNQGNVHVAHGLFACDAGAGSGTAAGGNAGFVALAALSSAGTGRPRWGVRSNGGAGAGGGGAGGTVQVIFSELLDIFMPIEANGGASISGVGGPGGSVVIVSSVLKGAATVSAVGGTGSNGAGMEGGEGGQVDVAGTTWFRSFALEATLNGGSGNTGGQGGICNAPTGAPLTSTLGIVDQVLIDVTANGGTGVVEGGAGGTATFVVTDSARNVTVDAQLHGGAATGATGVGGDGGSANFGLGHLGHDDDNLRVQVDAHGGSALAGLSGGDGGVILAALGTSLIIGDIELAIAGTLNGGDSSGTGGNGGLVSSPGTGIVALDFDLDVTANGGAGGSGDGGVGGSLLLGALVGASSYLELTGLFIARGGTAQDAAATGGRGGLVDLATSVVAGIATLDDFHVDLTGGDNSAGDGGTGGEFMARFNATTDISDCSVITNGGRGSTTSGTGVGGNGGPQNVGTFGFDLRIEDSVFRANGGDGRAGGGNGPVASPLVGIRISTTQDDIAPGAAADVDALVEANGGAALVSGNGGEGGSVLLDQNASVPQATPAATTRMRGTWLAMGGAGIAMGGNGGSVTMSSTGDAVDVNATVSVNGGSGATGGSGGTVGLLGSDTTATGTITVTVAGNMTANGGTGTAQGGNAGAVSSGGDDTHFILHWVAEANGGTGTIGGNGGTVQCIGGAVSLPDSITVSSSARMRANGGATNGDGGTIVLDPEGTGGLANPNYTEQAGSVIEANANGTGTAGTITRD